MIERSILKNGLQVVTNQMEGRDSIGLAIWVRVGSRHERKKVTGISHYVEHMLFKGTKQRTTRKIKEEIEGIGGSMNAFTGEECTCYFVKIPKQYFEASFDVLQDMVNDSILKAIEIEKERTVIVEEIKMYLDQPSSHVHELISELLWPDQPLGWPIAGTIKSVCDIERRDLVNHVRSFYHPNNLLVTACGDVTHQEVLDLTEKHFQNRKKKAPSKFSKARVKSRKKKSKTLFLNKKTEQTHFVLGFHGLPRAHPDRYRLAVLNVILGGNMSSRLFEELREQRGLAYEIRSGLSFFEGAGSLTISAGVEPKKAAQSIRVIMRELTKLKRKEVSKSELRRAKDYFLGQMSLGLEDTLDNILWYGERVLYGGPVPDINEIRNQIEHVSVSELKRIATQIFQRKDIHLALIGPLDDAYQRKVASELTLS
jgi:predicted Zn-dependent peptidase